MFPVSGFFLHFCAFSKIFGFAWGKTKVSFYKVYVCVREKVTFVVFFSVYFLHLPLGRMDGLGLVGCTVMRKSNAEYFFHFYLFF